MDMTIFQVESNKEFPRTGGLLIAAPFLQDFRFARSVVLMLEDNEQGSMGVVLNKNFSQFMTLNEVVPELASLPPIPLYNGGPVGRDTLFFLHSFDTLKDALPLGNGLYMNGDFEQLKDYILSGVPLSGFVRFFMGYAGWQRGQLKEELEANTWMVNNDHELDLLDIAPHHLWKKAMDDMGGKYSVWARYPKYPIMS